MLSAVHPESSPLFHTKCQVNHAPGTQSYWNNDDVPHEVADFGPLWVPSGDQLIQGIQVKCNWRDQGWGNQKGKLYIALKRRQSPENGGHVIIEGSTVDLFRRFADHSPRLATRMCARGVIWSGRIVVFIQLHR